MTLIYSTNFENITLADSQHLTIPITHGFQFDAPGGAAIWMEGLDRTTPGVTPHSGTRCLGMELTDITKSGRNEFNILQLENSITTNQLYVSVWLFLPAGFQLHSPTFNSFELDNPYFTGAPDYAPYVGVHIYQNPAPGPFDLDLVGRDVTNTFIHLQDVTGYALPVGVWFRLDYYVVRDKTNGTIKTWVNGVPVHSVTGISTQHPTITDWFTTPAKIYYGTDDVYSPYQLWVDDLAIYDSMPPQLTISGLVQGKYP